MFQNNIKKNIPPLIRCICKPFTSIIIFVMFFFTISDPHAEVPVFGISFPPVKNDMEREYTLEHLKELHISHIRIADDWKWREPMKGIYTWNELDMRIEFATKNNINLLLTIESRGPVWACKEINGDKFCIYKNDDDFRSYIDTLVKRYKNKISKIQFANEWELPMYDTDVKKLVDYNNILYDAVKNYSPKTEVVLGGLTRYIVMYDYMIKMHKELKLPSDDKFVKGYTGDQIRKLTISQLKNGSQVENKILYVLKNAKYDFVDIHLYDDIENWPTFIPLINKLISKPLIVTEFGCVNPQFETYSNQYHAERLALCLKTLSSLQIREAYYFSLVDIPGSCHVNNGLIDKSLNKKPSYEIFQTFLATLQKN